jgi:HAD superfamily hydrolase (TIGR01490 family)
VPTTRPAVAAFFDLDKTIIAKSSVLAFSRPFYEGGLITRKSVVQSTYAQLLFMVSGADHAQMERMRVHLTSTTAGWDVEKVKAIVAETLHEIVAPLVYKEAEDLIAEHKAQGHDVIVVSASGLEVVAPIAEGLGADGSIATRLEVVDGKYSGEVEFYAYGEGKVEGIKALADEAGYDLPNCYAYSDSITDAPMLELVGHPTAVNPDKALRKLAEENSWPIREFTNPVSLWSKLPSAQTTALATGAAGAILAAGALTINAARRKKKS